MIVAPQPEAAEAGADVLRAGGNAIDAAVACALVQTVVDPLMCGMGGFGSMHVYMPSRGVHEVLEFYARAPLACTPAMWESEFRRQTEDGFAFLLNEPTNQLGYLSVCTPGAPRGFDEALRSYGTMSVRDVISPAVHYARDGFMVRPEVHNYWVNGAQFGPTTVVDRLRYSPTGAEIYFRDDGALKTPGDMVVNEPYARTLERIASDGFETFYSGDVAAEICADMRRNGGLLTSEDLARFTVSKRAPIWGSYRGRRIATSPPPGSGVSMLELLHVMERFDVGSLEHGSTEHVRLLTEAIRRMTLDKDRFMGDPDYVEVPTELMLSAERSREHADSIRRGERARIVRPEQPHPRETTHVSVIDRDGNAAAMTHSLGLPSGVITDGLGFMYNGTMSRFDPRPGKSASIAPGKRRASSAAPSIMFDGAEPAMVIGAPGGSYIAPAVGQCIMNVVDFDMTMFEAVSAPRIMAVSNTIEVPNRVRRAVTDELEGLGYDVKRLWQTFAFAGLHGIRVDEGTCTGGADPGFDGMALAVPA